MQKRIRRVPRLLLALPLLLPAGPAAADELIRFKSGYEMMVLAHREERGMVIVTLEGGGEVGFPADAIDLLEGGKATERTGPSLHYNRIPSRGPALDSFKIKKENIPSRFLATGKMPARSTRVGYSMDGQGMQRFSGGPLGRVSSEGKIGTDLRIRRRSGGPRDSLSDRPGDDRSRSAAPTWRLQDGKPDDARPDESK